MKVLLAEQKVKHNFLGVTWQLIPDYLYKYNKRQVFTQHLNRYGRLTKAYNEVIMKLSYYHNEMNFLIGVWLSLPFGEKKENYNNNILSFMKDEKVVYTYELRYVNNFDALNLWYSKKVDDDTELDIERFYDLISFKNQQPTVYISIILRYKIFIIEIYDPLNSNNVVYHVTYQDVFNLLLHICCNGGIPPSD